MKKKYIWKVNIYRYIKKRHLWNKNTYMIKIYINIEN